MLRGRLPSIFSTSHKMPRLYHGICTLSPLDAALPMRFAKYTQGDMSKMLHLPRKMTMDVSKVLPLPRKLQRIFWKRCEKICACHTKRLPHVTKKRLNVTKCATPATRNEASKNVPFCRTYHRHGHIAIARTVANGCERLRT